MRVVAIRRTTPADWSSLAQALVAVHAQDGYPVEGVRDAESWVSLQDPVGQWTASVDGRPVGHVALSRAANATEIMRLIRELDDTPLDQISIVSRLFVHPDFRGIGLASQLMDEAENLALNVSRLVVLEVLEKDGAARKLYESRGWYEVGKIEHPQDDGAPHEARVMVLRLTGHEGDSSPSLAETKDIDGSAGDDRPLAIPEFRSRLHEMYGPEGQVAKQMRRSLANLAGAGFQSRIHEMYGPDSQLASQIKRTISILGADAWRVNLEPLVERLRKSHLPANLKGIEGLEPDQVVAFTLDYGIALFLVPRERVARRFLNASTSPAVRQILTDCKAEIIDDCHTLLRRCDSVETLPHRRFAEQALDALEGGMYGPAQSMAANLLDGLLAHSIEDSMRKAAIRKTGESISDARDRIEDLTAWEAYIVATLWVSFQHYRRSQGDPIPHVFSRHATTHAPASRQYSRRSALQALMAVTSTIAYLNGHT